MPESLATLRCVKSEKLNVAVALKRSSGVPLHPSFTFSLSSSFGINQTIIKSSDTAFRVAHFGHNDLFSELFRNLFCDVEGRSLERYTFLGLTVGKSDNDGLGRK